jgi:hypothetical protein
MSTAAVWKPYFNNVDDALDDALDGRGDILNLIGSTLDEVEGLMLLCQHAPDYGRQEQATSALADHLSGKLGYDRLMIQDVLRELANMNSRYRWSQHRTRLRKSREQLAKWKSCVAEYAAEIEKQAEAKLETALVDAGFLMDG